ncbi:MAG: ABC transporter permease [Clostridia bacterium]|nr:ABC transporter permease [Clostridia bacterium]
MNSRYSAFLRRFIRHKMAVFCLILLLCLICMAVFAPLITSYSPTKPSGKFQLPPGGEHILGTDKIGRDMFTRILYAMRVSLMVGLLSTLIATATGVTLGLISGYFGGIIDRLIMGFTDMVMSFPYILLVLVAASIFKPGMWSIVLILGFVDWPGVARLVRGNVLSLRETNFIKSDITAGMPGTYILFSEILPNTIAPVLVYATNVFAISILDEAALSFLGMGIQPPTPSLGNILNGAESLSVLTGKPWLWLPAGIVIFLLVICINFVGDALRDAFDPRSSL